MPQVQKVGVSTRTDDSDGIDTLRILKDVQIAASQQVVFESILDEMGPGMHNEDGSSMAMKVEAWPGGRWFRDLGNNAGHLWGHIQVIKPPTLLEVVGQMFMSYPAVNHVQYRLKPENGGTRLTMTHRGFGQISPEHAKGADMGWGEIVDKIKKTAEQRPAK